MEPTQPDLKSLLPIVPTEPLISNYTNNTSGSTVEIGLLGSLVDYSSSTDSTSLCPPPLSSNSSRLLREASNAGIFEFTSEEPNPDMVAFGDPLNFYSNRPSVLDRFGLGSDYVSPSSAVRGSVSFGYSNDWGDFNTSLWDDSADFFLRNTIFRRDPRSSR